MIFDDVYVTSKFLGCSTFCHMDIISHPTLKGGFDVIYGADIIYGALHTTWKVGSNPVLNNHFANP